MTWSPITVVSIALLLANFCGCSVQARQYHHQHRSGINVSGGCAFTNDGREQCGQNRRAARAPALDANGNRAVSVDDGTVIGGRPAGCPHAYCGCGLRKYLGLADKRLNLASNWARFFRHEAAPRAGLAAVRAHHVMYIERSMGSGLWLVRDYNSGGGLSRLHVRDLRGYVFVNPYARLTHGWGASALAKGR
jgi:hypothetical protein